MEDNVSFVVTVPTVTEVPCGCFIANSEGVVGNSNNLCRCSSVDTETARMVRFGVLYLLDKGVARDAALDYLHKHGASLPETYRIQIATEIRLHWPIWQTGNESAKQDWLGIADELTGANHE